MSTLTQVGIFKGVEKNARGMNFLATIVWLTVGLILWFIPRAQLKDSTTPEGHSAFVTFSVLAIVMMSASVIHFGFVMLHTYKIEKTLGGMRVRTAEAVATVVGAEEEKKFFLWRWWDDLFQYISKLFKKEEPIVL